MPSYTSSGTSFRTGITATADNDETVMALSGKTPKPYQIPTTLSGGLIPLTNPWRLKKSFTYQTATISGLPLHCVKTNGPKVLTVRSKSWEGGTKAQPDIGRNCATAIVPTQNTPLLRWWLQISWCTGIRRKPVFERHCELMGTHHPYYWKSGLVYWQTCQCLIPLWACAVLPIHAFVQCQSLQLMEPRTDCLATATYRPVDVHPFTEEDAQDIRYLHWLWDQQ